MKKGFTLVELMVVVGILSIIMLTISQPVASVIKYQRESQTADNMRDNLQFVINKMEKELKTSSGVNIISGGSVLTFTDQNAVKVEYCFSGQEIIRLENINCDSIPPNPPKLTDNTIFKVIDLKFSKNITTDLITITIKAQSLDNKDTVTMQISVLPLND